MKAQTVVISAYLAAVLVVMVSLYLYVEVFPYTTTGFIEYRRLNIIKLIREKTRWNAEDLAIRISESGADYVYVNITVISFLNGTVLYNSSYMIKPVDIPMNKLTIFHYQYSRLTRDGIQYIYDVEVGYR